MEQKIFKFLTHTVQMKLIYPSVASNLGSMFLTHTVQMKLRKLPQWNFFISVLNPHGSDETYREAITNIPEILKFLTHTVQMKRNLFEITRVDTLKFLTHTVQMKPFSIKIIHITEKCS